MPWCPSETGHRTSKTIAGTTYTNTIAANSNRLTQAQDVGGTANILHDAAGNIVNDSSYDAQGNLSAISVNPVNANGVGVSATAVPLLGTLTYNAENKVTGWQWSDGKARTIAYDGYGQISGYNLGDELGTGNTAGVLRSVSRDAAGRITGYSHTNNGAPVATLDQGFAYDKLNRLLSASLNGSSTQYSYDETGNRTSKTIAGTTYTNTIDANSNRLTQAQDVSGTANILHDAAGNIVNDSTFAYTYSDRGRLASVQTAGGTVSYLYNALNLRVYKSGPSAVVPTGAAYYLYDEAGQLLGEYDANGAPVYETVYLGMLPVGALKQTGSAATSDIAVSLYNVHADHIATPRIITQQDQQIVWRWDTAEAFGGSVPDQNPSGLGAFTYNQRFPGQVFDAETGLFQNWNREYNSRYGRYIESDPIGLRGGINTFAYVAGNPLSGVDPYGLWTFQIGFTFSAQWIPFPGIPVGPGGFIQVGVAFDGNGNVGGYWTRAKGAVLAEKSDVNVNISAAVSPNADTICDLRGEGLAFSLNPNAGGGTIDASVGKGQNGRPVGSIGYTWGDRKVNGFAGTSTTGVTLFGKDKSNCTCGK